MSVESTRGSVTYYKEFNGSNWETTNRCDENILSKTQLVFLKPIRGVSVSLRISLTVSDLLKRYQSVQLTFDALKLTGEKVTDIFQAIAQIAEARDDLNFLEQGRQLLGEEKGDSKEENNGATDYTRFFEEKYAALSQKQEDFRSISETSGIEVAFEKFSKNNLYFTDVLHKRAGQPLFEPKRDLEKK